MRTLFGVVAIAIACVSFGGCKGEGSSGNDDKGSSSDGPPQEVTSASLAQAQADGGAPAIASLLWRGIDVRPKAGAKDPWILAYGTLPQDARPALAAKVATRLKPDATVKEDDTFSFTRATIAADDATLGGLSSLAGDLAIQKPMRAPGAIAMILRSAARTHSADARKAACATVQAIGYAKGKMVADEQRPALDAALLAIASAPVESSPDACNAAILAILDADQCLPGYRCKADGARVDPRASSQQDEPLCNKDQLTADVTKELARPRDEVARTMPEYWMERFALAAATARGIVRPGFTHAHERRMYALTEPSKPECGMGVSNGTPCHCSEAAIRDQACRNLASPVSFSFCRFDVDEKKKTLSGVVETSPP